MKWLPLALAIVLAAIMAMMAFALPSQAHEWYPQSCCSNNDCYPLEWSDVRPEERGWRILTTGELIPYSVTRRTPPEGNGKFHRCSLGGDRNSRTLGNYEGKPGGACFWAPPQSF